MHAGSRTTRDCPGLSGTVGPTRTWDSQQRCMPAAGQPGTVPGCPGQKGQLGPGTHSRDACRQQDNPSRVVRDRRANSDLGLTAVMHAGSRTTRDCPGLSGTEGPTRTWDSQQRCMPAAGQPGTVPGCPGQKGQLGPGTHSSDACRQQDNPGLSRVVRDRRANSDLGLTAAMHAGSRTTRDCPGLSGTEGPTRTWDSQQ